MLTKCSECGLQVSTLAITCPHCGYPLTPDASPKPKSSRKRMRLPNGFGQISEIKNKRLRKPFRAMVTVGKGPNGRPICKLLQPEAYFKTYNEAYEALVNHHKNPFDPDKNITMSELFNLWFKEASPRYKSKNSINSITGSWAYCGSIYDMRVKDVRSIHIKSCIEKAERQAKTKDGYYTVTATDSIKVKIKSVFNMLFDYAVEYEYADKNYSKLITYTLTSKDLEVNSHIPYTDDEMIKLWANKDDDVIKLVLIQCYSGWRPSELLKMKISDVDLENRTFTGGSKTAAGMNRVVPIHHSILPLVRSLYTSAKECGSEYLCGEIGMKNTHSTVYNYFLQRYSIILKELEMNLAHRPHDGRKHFITRAKKKGVDEFAIKRIVGHAIDDITEKIYTDRDMEWLRNEIEKV